MSALNNLPKRGPGRPKGSPNRLQKEAKEVIAQAAEELGGMNRLVTWAQQDPLNERAFWATIYPKLLPLTVNAHLTTNLVAELSALNAEIK